MELPKFLKFLELSSENSLKLLSSNNDRTKRFLSFIGVLNPNKINQDKELSTTTNKENSNSQDIFHEIDLKETPTKSAPIVETEKNLKFNSQDNTKHTPNNTIPTQSTEKPAQSRAGSTRVKISAHRTTQPKNTITQNVPIVTKTTKTTEEPYRNPKAKELGALMRGNPTSPQTHTSAKKVANELAAQQTTNAQKSATTPDTSGMKKIELKKVIRSGPGQSR